MLSLASKEIKNYNQQENAVYVDHPPKLGTVSTVTCLTPSFLAYNMLFLVKLLNMHINI